ncbi:uncharacterized protein LOC125779428 [Bactrocera dorsalis]|uniref:Uncharacterized protein LOC125779428 n=1 Tax=Bactrocera dorsalis TaxID=27457 RepID=A0ABM3K5I7_BACDO|nr:uncharacterized protein LOC125779428 [Bactrocera dorsalis]
MPKTTSSWRKCIVGCNEGGITFGFPNSGTDLERRKCWLNRLGVSDETPKNIFACERHFSAKMRLEKRLRSGAVPDINLKVEPTFHVPNSELKNTILLGLEDFAPQVEEAVSNAQNASRQLFLSIQNEIEDEILEPLPFFEEDVSFNIDKAAQTGRGLTAGTERKKKLREENRVLKIKLDEKEQENRSLKAQLVEMAAELERCREQLRNSSLREQSDPLSLVCSKVPPQLGACIRSSFINSNRRTHGRRYDNFLKTIALGVFFLSPVAYRH